MGERYERLTDSSRAAELLILVKPASFWATAQSRHGKKNHLEIKAEIGRESIICPSRRDKEEAGVQDVSYQ